MNKRTSTIIRLAAHYTGRNPKHMKREWNGTPRNLRHKLRQALKELTES